MLQTGSNLLITVLSLISWCSRSLTSRYSRCSS